MWYTNIYELNSNSHQASIYKSLRWLIPRLNAPHPHSFIIETLPLYIYVTNKDTHILILQYRCDSWLDILVKRYIYMYDELNNV